MNFKHNNRCLLDKGLESNDYNDCFTFKSFLKSERKLLKVFLVYCLQKTFYGLFQNQIKYHHQINQTANSSMEFYIMDNKIVQILIHSIIETGEYTLEGIAYYTKIPPDIILEAASGCNNQLSITSWTRIVELYVQVKPEIPKKLLTKLLKIKNNSSIFELLKEM